MWLMAYRYHRKSFWVLTPVIVTLYLSTFYCRYHYVSDAVAGIAVALLALAVSPLLVNAWDRMADWKIPPRNIPTKPGQ